MYIANYVDYGRDDDYHDAYYTVGFKKKQIKKK